MSSKKPFDHIEDKIKQAAENNLPAFDEKAWQAMEVKLDKDKKKRRPLLWWFVLPLLLAGTGAVYYSIKSQDDFKKKQVDTNTAAVVTGKEEKNSIKTNERDNADLTATANNKNTKEENDAAENKSKNADNNKLNGLNQNEVFTATVTKSAATSPALVTTKKIAHRKKGKVIVSNTAGIAETGNEEKVINSNGNDDKIVSGDNSDVNNNTGLKQKEEKIIVANNEIIKEDGKKEKMQTPDKDSNRQEVKATIVKKEKEKEKEKTKKIKGLYVQATAGTDAGSTKLFSYSNSSITPKYGIGLGYQFNKRLSVQTGFYATNKKYLATPDDYTIKPGSPMALYQIDKINAACLVYEIPLSVKYNFISKPSFILFGTAGVSSYIMQKEQYDCSYIYYGTTYEKEWDYTGNRHLFSTAVFSFGIEKRVASQLFLLAEPSFSIPLSGVGDGKVNLYSSSLQLGLKYYFFKK